MNRLLFHLVSLQTILVLDQEIWTPIGFASSCSASRATTRASSNSAKIIVSSTKTKSVILFLLTEIHYTLFPVPSPYRCYKVMEQGRIIPASLPYSQERKKYRPVRRSNSINCPWFMRFEMLVPTVLRRLEGGLCPALRSEASDDDDNVLTNQ